MEVISQYIITLVTTIIFISAVEMIAPDNSTKKYIKFVLGLILVAVLITPIISIFTNGEVELKKQIEKFTSSTNVQLSEEDFEKQKEKRDETFKNNLNKNTEKILKEEFNNQNFNTDIDCNMNYENMTYSINEVNVGVTKGGIKTIKEIKIGNDSTSVNSNSESVENAEEIRAFISETFKIPSEKINLYNLD